MADSATYFRRHDFVTAQLHVPILHVGGLASLGHIGAQAIRPHLGCFNMPTSPRRPTARRNMLIGSQLDLLSGANSACALAGWRASQRLGCHAHVGL